MKKLFALFVLGIFASGMASLGFAQAAETQNATGEDIMGASAGMLPDSPFYGLKKFGEGIQMFFTFDSLEKAKLKYGFAQLRLMEADAMTKLNKTELAENALNEYEADLNETEADENSLSAAGRNTAELADLVGNSTYKHILVLQKVYEKAPDSAKSAIKKAIENSMERQQNIAERAVANKTVNITITVGNETVTREVPAAFAEKFLEMASEVKKRTGEEVEIENNTALKEHIAEKTGINREKAQEQIDDAREQISEAAQELAGLNDTNSAANKLLQNAELHLNKSEQAFNDGKYGEAFGQAISAEAIAKNAERLAIAKQNMEDDREELKIAVTNGISESARKANNTQTSNLAASGNNSG